MGCVAPFDAECVHSPVNYTVCNKVNKLVYDLSRDHSR